MIKPFPVITLLLLVFQAGIFSNPALLEEAIKNIQAVKMDEYAYTVTTIEKEQKTIELYEPLLEDDIKWQLVLKNNQFPTAKEHKEYKEKKLKELKDRQEQGTSNNPGKKKQQNLAVSLSLNDFIDIKTLQIIAETGQEITYAFKPPISDNPSIKMMQNMDCLLKVNKSGKYIEFLSMKSPAPFSPFFGVEVKQFKMEMAFAPEKNGQNTLIREAKFLFQGSAFVFKKFDQEIVTIYGNYQYRGHKNG